HANQMRAVLGAAVDVRVHSVGRDAEPVQRLRREALLQRLLERLHAEYAVRARAGYGDADLRATLRRKDPNQRKTRGLIAELLVAGLLHQREAYLGDDLVGAKRRLEQAFEEVVRLMLAFARVNGGAEADAGRRIVRIRIVVGDRTAERAAMAHR